MSERAKTPPGLLRAGDVAGADQSPLDLRPRDQIRLKVSPPSSRGIANPSQFWNPVSWLYLCVAAGVPSIKRRGQTCGGSPIGQLPLEEGPGDGGYRSRASDQPSGDLVPMMMPLPESAERKSNFEYSLCCG
jgi:hypothetical protein